MTPDRDDSDDEPAWHERTSTVVGASIGALAAIGLLWLAISWMVGGSDEPSPASQYFLEPSASGTSPTFTTTSTTETITSTSPPMTTDIDPGDTSSTSTTPSTDTTTSFNPSNLPHTRTPSTYDDGRRRPTFNETRTLYPRPGN